MATPELIAAHLERKNRQAQLSMLFIEFSRLIREAEARDVIESLADVCALQSRFAVADERVVWQNLLEALHAALEPVHDA